MFESLTETVKAFSFQSVLKGNILSSPGSFGGGSSTGLGGAKSNSPASNMVSNKYLSTYYNIMREINDYEINDLSNTIVGIYRDYLINYINKDTELITVGDSVPNYAGIQAKLNQVFKDLDIINEVKTHIWDIIYHGAWCFRIEFDQQLGRYKKSYLQNPHNVITIYKNEKPSSHLVISKSGKIYEVKPDTIFRLGRADLTLINDINTDFFNQPGAKKDDTLIKDEMMVAGTPLYYNMTGKVKEYLLKEQLLSLLSIKDLIQPLLLMIQLDKNTSIDEGNKLALNVENMINKYSDISSIISSNFSINSLIDSLMNNIRVIPDYHSGVGNMNNLNLDKVTSKAQEIESSLDNKKDSIMNANSIPRALYSGESTKWDAIKSSQRLNSRVHSYVVGISDSIKLEAVKLCKDIFNIDLQDDNIKVNLFKKTDADYALALTNIEIVGSLSQGLLQILQNCQQTISDIKLINPESFAKYILNQLKTIDPNIIEFMNETTIHDAIVQAMQQQQAPQ